MTELASERITQLHEEVIAKHKATMYPFWIFADIMGKEIRQGEFWCFIGAHYPAGLTMGDNTEYNCALSDLRIGHWKEMALRNGAPKAGFGCAETPSLAFIKACRMAGYLKAEA